MENYGSNSPNPYYAYRPPNSDQYSPPRPYPYPPPPLLYHSGPLHYTHPPPPTYYASFHYQHQPPPPPPYPYPAHQPTLQPPHATFGNCGSYQDPPQYPPPHNVASLGMTHENVSSDASSSPSLYPPLDELLGGLNDSVNQPTSAPALSAPYLPSQSSSSWQGNFYEHPSNSFSSHSDYSYSGRLDSSSHGYTSTGSPHTAAMPFAKSSLKVLLLHGNMDIWVSRANNLPNMDLFHKTLGVVFGNMSNMIEGQLSKKITSDPYVSIALTGAVVGRTYVISNSENPVWQQHFYVPVAHHAAEVHFVVKDSDVVGSQLIGLVTIPVEQMYSGSLISSA